MSGCQKKKTSHASGNAGRPALAPLPAHRAAGQWEFDVPVHAPKVQSSQEPAHAAEKGDGMNTAGRAHLKSQTCNSVCDRSCTCCRPVTDTGSLWQFAAQPRLRTRDACLVADGEWEPVDNGEPGVEHLRDVPGVGVAGLRKAQVDVDGSAVLRVQAPQRSADCTAPVPACIGQPGPRFGWDEKLWMFHGFSCCAAGIVGPPLRMQPRLTSLLAACVQAL